MSEPNKVAVVPTTSKKSRNKIDDADSYLKDKLVSVVSDPKKSYHDILSYIKNEITESTRIISFNYKIKCFKEDGAYALSRAVEEIHGFTTQKNTGPSGNNPPQMIDVRFADGTRQKVPFGTVSLPAIGEGAHVDMQYDVKTQQLLLVGQCEKRFVRLMDEIVEETTRLVREDSIYRGKAIKITDETVSPTFIDLTSIDQTPLFLTPDAVFATQPIEARIEHTERCRKNGIDLKFGVLLEGNYGTGKTLYAFKLALKAINNGWSFIYCPNPEKSLYVMEVAAMLSKNGKGVVVFIEDVDKVLNERNTMTNEISLMMDGGETKHMNIITILTTNHLENINPTFVRGKRIGSIVTLSYPDKETAKKMIERYLVDEFGNSILAEDCDDAAQEIENNRIVPAFIAEILDRVKSHLIYSGKETVTCQDIVNSIKSYKKQMEIATVRVGQKTDDEIFVESFKKIVGAPVLDTAEMRTVLTEVLAEKGF
jgi:transitional endoplasmic reticulum ATPase